MKTCYVSVLRDTSNEQPQPLLPFSSLRNKAITSVISLEKKKDVLPRTIYFVEIKILIIQGCRQNRYSEDKLHIDQEKVSLGHTLGHKDRPSKPHNQGPVVQSPTIRAQLFKASLA